MQLKELDLYEKECIENIPKLRDHSKSAWLVSTKNDLVSSNLKMKWLVVDDALWKSFDTKSKSYLDLLEKLNKELRDKVFLGQERKSLIETKYLNVLDLFCSHIGFNT